MSKIKTLTTQDDYGEVELAFWRRGRKTIGFAFGLVMCLASVIRQTSVLGFGLALSTGLITGAITGFLFAWMWSWLMRRSSRRMLDRVFAGDPDVVGDTPTEPAFRSRMPCSLFLTSNVAIGGILYIGRTGIRFVPHRRFRHESVLGLDAEGLVVWVRDWTPNWWGRLFVASGPRLLELRSGEQTYCFSVPDADAIVPIVRNALGQ